MMKFLFSQQVFFQLVLTTALLGIGVYAVALRRRIVALGTIAILVVMLALMLIWRPATATAIANLVGIGRGADLVFYCWVVISFVMILHLHFSLRSQLELITELTRQLALQRPVSAGRTSGKGDPPVNS